MSACAKRSPIDPAMMNPGISKMPWGMMAAATKAGLCSCCTSCSTAPITTPFKLMMKIVKTPNEAPPMKSRMQASRLLKKIFRHRSGELPPATWPATSFSNSPIICSPISGWYSAPTQPIVTMEKKSRSVRTVALARDGSDIQDHPHHVPDARREPDYYHGEEDEVPERHVRLFPVRLHDPDAGEEHEKF